MAPLKKWAEHHLTSNDPLCPTTHEPTTLLIHVTTTPCTSPTLTISQATPVITVRRRFIITTQLIRTVRTNHATLPTITRRVALVVQITPIILVLLPDITSLEG